MAVRTRPLDHDEIELFGVNEGRGGRLTAEAESSGPRNQIEPTVRAAPLEFNGALPRLIAERSVPLPDCAEPANPPS